jgi:hypothetical protein
MRAVIVFESMFGNTEAFAREIADGLSSEDTEVSFTDVRHVRPEDLAPCDLLVVGAPTHAFSLSRPNTREDAVRQGAPPNRAAVGVREWLPTLAEAFPEGGRRPVVAVFDTRVEKVRHLPGSAARRSARMLRGMGFHLVGRPTSFFVGGVAGPPTADEPARARAWAQQLRASAGNRLAS